MTMRLQIEAPHLHKLISELGRAGAREIGGVLVGEHVGGDDFRLIDLSVQRRGGGHAHFNRDPVQAARFVDGAIARSGGDATRINYLGEWHSHPLFSASPSTTDVAQMQQIVEDPDGVASFGVLIVVSGRPHGLEMSATLFRPDHPREPVDVHVPGTEMREHWRQASSEPVDHPENESGGAPDEIKDTKEGILEWERSGTDSTPRPWWRRWVASAW
jgi:proteasome lid subunit RPN8/RPN11